MPPTHDARPQEYEKRVWGSEFRAGFSQTLGTKKRVGPNPTTSCIIAVTHRMHNIARIIHV